MSLHAVASFPGLSGLGTRIYFPVLVLRCEIYEITGVKAWVALELLKYGYQCVGLVKFFLVMCSLQRLDKAVKMTYTAIPCFQVLFHSMKLP